MGISGDGRMVWDDEEEYDIGSMLSASNLLYTSHLSLYHQARYQHKVCANISTAWLSKNGACRDFIVAIISAKPIHVGLSIHETQFLHSTGIVKSNLNKALTCIPVTYSPKIPLSYDKHKDLHWQSKRHPRDFRKLPVGYWTSTLLCTAPLPPIFYLPTVRNWCLSHDRPMYRDPISFLCDSYLHSNNLWPEPGPSILKRGSLNCWMCRICSARPG